MSKVDGCNLERISSLPFQFVDGSCTTYGEKMDAVMLCFGSSPYQQCSRSVLKRTVHFGCYCFLVLTVLNSKLKQRPIIHISDHWDSQHIMISLLRLVRTIILTIWRLKFTKSFVHGRLFQIIHLLTQLGKILSVPDHTATLWHRLGSPHSSFWGHAAVTIEKAVYIIGGRGYTDGTYSSNDIAKFENNEWSRAGELIQGRDVHNAITNGELTMVFGGYTFDDNP